MSVSVPDYMRPQLRLALSGSAVPVDLVDTVVDLAIHAAEQGFATMQRIALGTYPDERVGITTLGPALGMLQGLVEAGFLALNKIAAEDGIAIVSFQVGGGQHD